MGTSVGNLIPNEIKKLAGSDVGKLVGGSAGFGVGGATGAAAATGNDVSQGAALDIAGLSLASPISSLTAPAAAGAAGGAAFPWLSNAPAGSVFAPSSLNIAPAAGSDLITLSGAAEAAAAGATPWLSNAPAGSVFSPSAAEALRIPQPGNIIPSAQSWLPNQTIQTQNSMLRDTGQQFSPPTGPQAPSPMGPTGTPPPPPPSAPPPPTGGFVDNLLRQMKDNALSLGLIGTSMLLAGRPQPMPSQAQLEGLSAEAQATANQLLAQYRSGQLAAGQQAQLDQLTRQTKNQITNYFASIGQADSTAHQQALAQVDQQALGMRQQMLDNMLNQGLSAIGVASGPLQTVAQYQLGQDQALRQALGNFAGAVGLLMGRSAGTPQPAPQPPRPQQPQPTGTVQSFQS